MQLSIVIPTYNMAGYLDQTLRSLRGQAPHGLDALDIVVVDDGSDDHTQVVLAQHASQLPLRSVSRGRDAQSCRARARNDGLRACRGEFVFFVDSGVILEPRYLERLCRKLEAGPPRVFVAEVLGLNAHHFVHDFAPYLSRDPMDTLTRCVAFRNHPGWMDTRAPLFESVENDLSRLPAPWSLGWSCALALPRAAAMAVDGFDESLRGWGGEDTDFCFRLWRAGAGFAAFREALAVHLPHPTEDIQAKHRSWLENRRHLHQHASCLETEVGIYLWPVHDNLFLRYLEGLILPYVVPVIDPELVATLREQVVGGGPCLLVGPPSIEAARRLGARYVATHTRAQQALFSAALPGTRVIHSVGCATAFTDAELEAVILTDTTRLYPSEIQAAQLKEALRVGKRAFALFSADDQPAHGGFPGWYRGTWSSLSQFRQLASSVGLRAVEIRAVEGVGWAWELKPG
jgi:glycosyltransferase involved in cell wall biosynthesis